MRYWTRGWKAVAAIFLGFAAIPGAVVIIQAPAATADVCASVGRRVSVSGCANLADTIADYVPPPSYLPGDEPAPEYTAPPPPPPPPAPNVSVCANVGRRVSVSGCV